MMRGVQFSKHGGTGPGDIQNVSSSGIVCELPEPVWRDKTGEVVKNEEQAFGRKNEFDLIHPDHIIFVDKLSEIPPNIGGEAFLCTVDG